MKKKMFIAGMSLAVALILLATASFAWFTISTNPEVKGMDLALYTNRTLLLASGDGTDTVPGSDEFKQYLSLSDDFAGLASLRPVSTADGINWFLPSYDTESGDLSEVSEFILDDTLEHGNVSILDENGNRLTGDALFEASSRGYYVYTDIWMKTEEDGAKVRLSIPRSYGSAGDRHAGTVGDYALESEELTKAVYGTYVLGEPELDENDSTKLKTRTEEPEKALRVGFLIYQDEETLEPVTEDGTPYFVIYEPNADRRAAGTAGELLISDRDGNDTVTRDDYIAGSAFTGLEDNAYYVTQPIAKSGEDEITLGTISENRLIAQRAGEWDDASVIKTLNGQWENGSCRPNSNDVKTFGQFLNVDSGYSRANSMFLLTDTEDTEDISGNNLIVTLKKDTPIRVRLFVWLEGQDVDCWNDIATGTFRINLELAGETVYTEEEEETEPQSVLTCTLKGYGTNGNSSDGWFNSSAAGTFRTWVTEVEFTRTAPTEETAHSWNAGTGTGEEAIMAYCVGKKVYIVVPAGADKISLPEDSSRLFEELRFCTAITGLDKVDTSNVTDMSSMFNSCKELTTLDVSGFNTAAVTDMNKMFYNCDSLTSLNLRSFNTAAVTDMSYMFYWCSRLTTLDVSSFNTAAVTDMNNMFYYCKELTALDVSGFDTAKVTDMNGMFYYCRLLTTLDVSGFDTALVTNMKSMFDTCDELTTLDVSSFNTAAVTDMRYMFRFCEELTAIYASDGWSTALVTESDYMCHGCTSLVGGAGTAYDSTHTDKTYARIDGGTANPGYFTAKTVN